MKYIEEMLQRCLEHRWGTALLGLLCVVFLFPPWGYPVFRYGGDVQLNAWAVQYYKFFFEGLSIPTVINVPNHVSLNVIPIYYARPLHWAAALLTFCMPVRVSLWCILGVLSWIQYGMCAYAFTKETHSRAQGNMLAAIMLLSSYAMCNAYGRGALAEYAGASLLVSFVCALLAIIGNPARKKELLILAAVFFSLLGNIHSITTFSGTLCFAALALYALFIYFTQQKGRWDIPVFLLASFIVVGSMAHLLYLVGITDAMLFIKQYYQIVFLEGIDNLFLRFQPVPVAFQIYGQKPLAELFLGPIICQINVGLLILLAASLFFVVRRAVADRAVFLNIVAPVLVSTLLLLAALFLTYVSAKPVESELVNAWLTRVQFPYRLITQINILLMIGIFFLCPVLVRQKLRIPYARQMVLLLALGTVVYMAQLLVLRPTMKHFAPVSAVDSSLPNWHPSFYGTQDYATLQPYPVQENAATARLVPLIIPEHATEVLFTAPTPVAEGEVLRLAVLPFIWNQVYAVNQTTGKRERLLGDRLRASLDPPGLYVNGLPEGRYAFEAAFTPTRIWLLLRYLYVFSTLVGGAALVCIGLRLVRERYGEAG